jgi:hypothetical protein
MSSVKEVHKAEKRGVNDYCSIVSGEAISGSSAARYGGLGIVFVQVVGSGFIFGEDTFPNGILFGF